MKKIKLNGKLNLNKTVISKLNQSEMANMKGGRITTESVLLTACGGGGGQESRDIICPISDKITDAIKTKANC